MNEVRNVINLWPARALLASECGVTEYALEQWEKRGYIPPMQWPNVVNSAKKHRISKINLEYLAKMKKRN